MTGPQEADTLVALPEAQAVDDGMGRSLQNRIRQEAERQTLEAAARARAELERRQAAAAEEMARLQTESETPNTAALIPGIERGRVGASGGASAGGAGAKNPLAPRPARRSVVQGSERSCGVVRGRWRRHRWRGRRGCGPPREHGPSGSRLLRAVARGARGRAGGGAASPRVPGHRCCCARASLRSSGLQASQAPAPGRFSPAVASSPLTRRVGSGSTRARSSRRCSSLSSRAISRDRCSPWSRSRSIRPTASGS